MKEKEYKNPYLMGFLLGLTLLLTYYYSGHGIGASGAFYRVVAEMLRAVSPGAVGEGSAFYSYLQGPEPSHSTWLIFEVVGILIGGFVSGLIGRRVKWETIKGKTATRGFRLMLALVGGILIGFASKLTLGCTSGQGLSGAAVLSVGSWVFLFSVFGGGFMAAYFVRNEWK
jgi:hypothetical protein